MKYERNLSGILFLLCMIITYVFSFAAAKYEDFGQAVLNMPWGMSAIASELMIVLPALLILGIWIVIQEYKESANEDYEKVTVSDRLMLKGVKVSTLLMTVLLTFLILPLSTVANYISMLFVDNEVLESSGDIINMTAGPAIILVAIFGPMCEEFVFRGMIFGGYRRACSVFSSVLVSGILFGLMHLNFNQCGYTFILGCWMAIVAEATGSIWPPVLIHFIINFRSTAGLFISNYIDADALNDVDMSILRSKEYRIYFLIYAVVAVITTIIACAVTGWLAKNEGRVNPFTEMTKKDRKAGKAIIITPSLVIGIILALAYMILSLINS